MATWLVPSTVVPLRNCTEPAAPAPAPVTVAVSVGLAGATAEAGDTARAVVAVVPAAPPDLTLVPVTPAASEHRALEWPDSASP